MKLKKSIDTKKMKSLKFKISAAIIVVLLIILSAFFTYVNIYYKAGNLAVTSLISDSTVQVEQNGDIIFKPVDNDKKVGFIFYPGGKVEALAYAPIAKEVASNGYTVIIAKMPFGLAVFSPSKAEDIINNNKEISTWTIGGHSLGGVMAASYANKSDKVKGLVLLASYPQDDCDFTKKDIKVLSLWGEKDKVADIDKITKAKLMMPSDATFEQIEGGNHGGFGDYGHQKGDGEASITNEEQMSYTAQAIIKLLDSLSQQ